MFDERKHPRDVDGKFTSSDGAGGTHEATEAEKNKLRAMGIHVEQGQEDKNKTSTDKIVKVDMNSTVQKQLDAANTPKERQEIAFRYIMDNLRGQYTAPDGRTVAIERVGADKMTYQDNHNKLRVCPALADMIKAGEYDHSATGEDKPHKKFEEFAYYKVRVQMGDEIYAGMLNVGIRKDGSSTLYDLRPFRKESK